VGVDGPIADELVITQAAVKQHLAHLHRAHVKGPPAPFAG